MMYNDEHNMMYITIMEIMRKSKIFIYIYSLKKITFIYPGTVQFSTRLVFVVIQHQFQYFYNFSYALQNNRHDLYIGI